MKMKKRWIPLFAAAVVALNVMPAAAVDTVLDTSTPAGDTSVTAKVEPADNGEVSYVISIPSRVDFGTLTRPANSIAPVYAETNCEVKLTEVENLDKDTQVIAVLVQDAANKTSGFYLWGQDAGNADKYLVYNIGIDEKEVNDTNNYIYQNGFFVAGFNEANQTVGLRLKLDQNQLLEYELDQVVGNYKGTLNFYSKVAGVNDYQ